MTLDFETVKYIKESTSCVYCFQEKRETFSLFERSRCADSFAAVPSSKTLTFSLLLLVHCCTVWPTSVLIILFFSFSTRVWSKFWNQCFLARWTRISWKVCGLTRTLILFLFKIPIQDCRGLSNNVLFCLQHMRMLLQAMVQKLLKNIKDH